MRRIGTILVLTGSAALVWCLTVLASAAVYQWYVNRHWYESTRWHEGRPRDKNRGIERVAAFSRSVPKLHDVIGRLDIPRLHVSTIVLEGDDDGALGLGAGHVPGTALPDQSGNVGIAAHRDLFFRPLRNVAKNDRITLTTSGGTYQYMVESTEIVRPDAVRVLAATRDAELTLVTCYPFYFIGDAPLRFIVHARRIG
jgi:sortase A